MSTSVSSANRDPARDSDWQALAAEFQLRTDTTYLNHGSFGLPPRKVRAARMAWRCRLDEQPMDFYLRQLEPALISSRNRLASFLDTEERNLAFVENATYGMNIVARSISLKPGDEVLLGDHEYGAVHRIWERACREQGATLVVAPFPERLESADELVDSLLNAANERTRLLVISHITSATALVLPIASIIRKFQERGILVCVDGPHAPAQVELNLRELACDFYTASLHKWLCNSLGTGFLYVAPQHQPIIEAPIKSWGRLLPAVPDSWDEEFMWMGTRDPSGFLALPAAIDWLEDVGADNFRARSRWLAAYAEARLSELCGTTPIGCREQGWYGSMAHVPLPPGDWSNLQKQIWSSEGIEVMINQFRDRWHVRVSSHLYNHTRHVDHLIRVLKRLLF